MVGFEGCQKVKSLFCESKFLLRLVSMKNVSIVCVYMLVVKLIFFFHGANLVILIKVTALISNL